MNLCVTYFFYCNNISISIKCVINMKYYIKIYFISIQDNC